MATAQQFVNIALAEEGYMEKASNSSLNDKTANKGSANYTKYGAWYGDNGAYWCQQFVSWVAYTACGNNKEAGKKLLCGGYSEYTPTGKQYFVNAGRYYKTPEMGDVVYFYYSSKGRVAHVGIVTSVNKANKTFTTMEGNTSSEAYTRNGGCVAPHTYSYASVGSGNKVDGFGRPIFDASSTSSTPTISNPWLEKGDAGSSVKSLQTMLIALGYSCGTSGADGEFGNGTYNAVIAFQKANGLAVDGQAGTSTLAKLNALYNAKVNGTKVKPNATLIRQLQSVIGAKVDGEAGSETLGKCPVLQSGAKSEVVRCLQRILQETYKIGVAGGFDGEFGNGTKAAVIEFQHQRKLEQDGIVGKATWTQLLGL